MKICLCCKELKELSSFGSDKSKKDGLEIYCRACRKIKNKLYRESNCEKIRKARRRYNKEHKKERNEYSRKYNKEHKKELKEKRKEYLQKHKKEISERSRKYYQKNKKKISEYDKKYSKKYHKKHKKERNEYGRKYYREHKKELKEARKKYYQEHQKEIKERYKEYNKKRRKKIREYERHRKRTHLPTRIKNNLRCRINHAIKNNTKSAHTMELIGCSIEYFLDHIQKQFKPGMTWDNHNLYGWHIDHIKPCASFDLTDPEEQKKCFHYSNMQPLWAEENWSKKAKDGGGE